MDSREITYSYHFAKTTFRARQYHTPCSVFLGGQFTQVEKDESRT